MPARRTLWLLGSTGSVGARVLSRLGEQHPFERIYCIGRRAPPLAARAQVHHFADFSAAYALPPGAVTDVACALGSNYVNADAAEFWRIDHDVPLHIAREARRRGARRFVLVSTFGAHPRAPMRFARARGVLEEALLREGFERLTVLHPSFIVDSHIARTPLERAALGATVWLSARVSAVARSPLAPTTCDQVARAVIDSLPA